ncbi:MAG: SDR family oxidoreductase [Ahrensia sp.]|nr:SDR family oxidoreductase [Ahrensia sp.]
MKINALITGGAHRVGRAIALDLAAHGFGVVIHANTSIDAAKTLADEITASGGRAFAVQADLTNTTEAMGLIDKATALAGNIDILVNNASIFEADDMASLDEELWDKHFAIHLKAPAFLTAELARINKGADALVVNIIDHRVWRLKPTFISYTLSKAALWTATQTMAQALAPKIRVNAIGPGPALANDRQSAQDFADQVATLILQRGPQLDEFGATIRYFWAAKSITGQMIALDGGQHLSWQTPDSFAKE